MFKGKEICLFIIIASAFVGALLGGVVGLLNGILFGLFLTKEELWTNTH